MLVLAITVLAMVASAVTAVALLEASATDRRSRVEAWMGSWQG